jgi:AraC-like DNA-binding protein
MQILPIKELLPFIKHFLFLESEGNSIKKLRLFSDGNTGIVFSFKSQFISPIKDNKMFDYLPSAFVYGQISEFKDLYLAGDSTLIIVVFQPSGINQLLGIPAYNLRDTIIKIEDFFGSQGLELQEQLLEQSDLQSKLRLLNTFFMGIVSEKSPKNKILIQASLNFIVKNQGLVSLHQLVKHTGYTERHIERIFMETIGLNPKKFSNIIRLHSFIKYIKEGSNDLTTNAYDAGYSDQSHLIRDFKKYTGITPKEYLTKTNKLAINFMELNTSKSIAKTEMSDLYNLPNKPNAIFVQNFKINENGQFENFSSSI